MNTIGKLTAIAACALALAACGGGGDGGYTVTPSVSGSGGTISPSKAVSVSSGATTSFQVTPNAGYTASVGGTCGGTLKGTTYTTQAITADCTVVATFTAVSNALTFRYETQPDPRNSADFLRLLNQEGAKGYSYLFDNNNNYYNTHGLDDLSGGYLLPFVNDGSGQVYDYELLQVPSNMADFITQANAEGARGYRYDATVGWLVINIDGSLPATDMLGAGILYRKDSGSSARYTYALEPATDNVSDQVVQANQRGQSGYLLILPQIARVSVNGADLYNLYVKNNASNAVYVYEINTSATSGKELLLAQLNSEGAKGYRTLPGDWRIYVKDQSQNATFAYQSAPENLTLDQMNSYGMQGYAYWGQYAGNTANAYYYVKANNCKGLLCTVSNPAVRNFVAW